MQCECECTLALALLTLANRIENCFVNCWARTVIVKSLMEPDPLCLADSIRMVGSRSRDSLALIGR